MSEIEKMYENAGIEKQEPLFCEYFNYSSRDLYERCTRFNKYCADGHFGMKEMCPCGLSKSEYENMFKYPTFTAEKQLNITKLIGLRYGLKFITNEGMNYMLSTDLYNIENISKQGYGYGYDEAIANLVNILWQDLTPEEKQQVKGILE